MPESLEPDPVAHANSVANLRRQAGGRIKTPESLETDSMAHANPVANPDVIWTSTRWPD